MDMDDPSYHEMAPSDDEEQRAAKRARPELPGPSPPPVVTGTPAAPLVVGVRVEECVECEAPSNTPFPSASGVPGPMDFWDDPSFDEMASSDTDLDDSGYACSDPESEDEDDDALRTLRAWDARKVEIEGPATWGICSRTKKPRTRRPNRTAAEPARDEYAAHKHEMASEHPHDHETQFVTSSRTRWHSKRARFHTQLKRIPGRPKTMSIRSHTWADACRADAAAVACADANGISWKVKRAQKKLRFATNAPRRAKCVATYGDNCALERRELLRLRDHVHRATNRRVRVLICPDGCWADALFRTEAMPAGQWLAWQHKSTAKMGTYERAGKDFWAFGDVLGYADALVVCSVKTTPELLWVLRGKVLDDHGVRNMKVTKSKKTGKILNVPADGKTLPTNLDGLVAALEAECAKVVGNDATALRTFAVEEAEAMLGKKHGVERAGVRAWMRCAHGGDQVPWLQMPEAMRDDNRNLRLLRDGTVVAYPEGQNTKVDLEVLLHNWRDPEGRKTTYQFKTAARVKHKSGFGVGLETAAGRDEAGTRLRSNAYKAGDNDVYVIVIPDTASVAARQGHVDVWEIPEVKLLELGLLGTANAPPSADVGSFYVHRASSTTRTCKHGWTRAYHMHYRASASGWCQEGDDSDDSGFTEVDE
jgi:hypothetical protein